MGVTRTSWYGGPRDSGDNNRPASGIPNTIPGFALPTRGTLGGYYVAEFPNRRRVMGVHSDMGPAPWTGRGLDTNYTMVREAGYTEGNFPTDSKVRYWFVGKDLPLARARAQALRAEIPGYARLGGRWEPGQPSERPVGRAAAGPVSENPLAAAMARRPLMVSAPPLPWFMGGGA